MTLPPLSLYIHIPWCVRKCPYCDFNSHESHQEIPEQAYLDVLKQDLALDIAFIQGRKIQSIFFGGGTPSLMSGAFYRELIEHLSINLDFAHDIEITMEANPGTTEAGRFAVYREAGINRLSLGVQSFRDEQLKALGRIHSAKQASAAIVQAKQAGFDNFNIDLMHGLPGQGAEQAMEDLQAAFDLNPTHISWYQLTIEANTEFYSKPPILPDEDVMWEIQEAGERLLAANGYRQYEVSAYAQAQWQSRHNLNYWRFGDYIGLGAGAHSKASVADSGHILRYRKSRLPKDYMKARITHRVAEEAVLVEDLPFEFLMNALRLTEGVDERLYSQRTGLPLASLEPKLSYLRKQGLLLQNRLQLTVKGRRFLNSVLEHFVES